MIEIHPIFATRQPARIAEVQQLLAEAGIVEELSVVFPQELEHAAVDAADCLVIVDGQSPPSTEALARLRRAVPSARILIWTDVLVPELLLAMMECQLDGFIASDLPRKEAAEAISRICQGERILRFDSVLRPSSSRETARSVAATSPFDAQWMLDGVEPRRREK